MGFSPCRAGGRQLAVTDADTAPEELEFELVEGPLHGTLLRVNLGSQVQMVNGRCNIFYSPKCVFPYLYFLASVLFGYLTKFDSPHLRGHLHIQWRHQERSAVWACRSHHRRGLHDLLCDGWNLNDLHHSAGLGVWGQRWCTQTWPKGLAIHGGGGEEQHHH